MHGRGTDVQIMTQVVEQDAPPPSSRVPDYPGDLEEIVLAALARDRAARVPSAAHLGAYLEELAMRHGMLVGPRAVARYFGAVAPAEPIREEALGMVEEERPRLEVVPDSEARRVWGPEAEEPLPDIDEREVLDDLRLLAIPDENQDDLDLAVDVSFADETLSEEARPTFPAQGDSSSLVLDGFSEDGGASRPVVLLDERARKDPTGKTRTGADYVDELERRLAGDSDD